MTVTHAVVEIVSANGVGGKNPFVVACLDEDINNELYKSKSTYGGPVAKWNEQFDLDLALTTKNHIADGKPEPSYLTLFIYDAGTPGYPSLGSAGVLLKNLHSNRAAAGDFPVINGNGGTLTVRVKADDEKKKWFPNNAGKVAAGALGVGALTAAGLTAFAVRQKKKKKQAEEATANAESEGAQPDYPDEDDGNFSDSHVHDPETPEDD